MNLHDRIAAAGRVIATAGRSYRDFEREQNWAQLLMLAGHAEARAILAIVDTTPDPGTAERVAIELVKAGLTVDQIEAALPTVFWDVRPGDRLNVAAAVRRAEAIAMCTNTLALTAEQIPMVPLVLRRFAPEEIRP